MKLVERFHPLQVILFGSHAYGRPTRDSDVDLLLVVRRKTDPDAVRCALPTSIAIDVLVRTENQVRRRLALGDCFMQEITQRGRILYDAHRARVG